MGAKSVFDIVAGSLIKSRSDRLQRAVDDPTLDTDRVLYHWTEAEDIQQLKPSTRGKLGPGIYTLPEPKSGSVGGLIFRNLVMLLFLLLSSSLRCHGRSCFHICL